MRNRFACHITTAFIAGTQILLLHGVKAQIADATPGIILMRDPAGDESFDLFVEAARDLLNHRDLASKPLLDRVSDLIVSDILEAPHKYIDIPIGLKAIDKTLTTEQFREVVEKATDILNYESAGRLDCAPITQENRDYLQCGPGHSNSLNL